MPRKQTGEETPVRCLALIPMISLPTRAPMPGLRIIVVVLTVALALAVCAMAWRLSEIEVALAAAARV